MRSIISHRFASFPFYPGQQRWIVTNTGQARSLLGIAPSDVLEMATLRKAYFITAKQCHPDTSSSLNNEEEGHERFLQVTEAYELLVSQLQQSSDRNQKDQIIIIPKSEEESFRRQCQETLGLSAEIVEECKTNHGFRQWLAGNTDAAHLWRNFLMQHGGLAPRLQGNIPVLSAGTISTNQARRRRKR